MASGSIYLQTARHRRIEILLQVGCAKYVRALIMKHVNDSSPEDTAIIWNLDEFLKRKRREIDRAQSRRNEKLNERERNLLYPMNDNTNIKKWDLSLLIRIYLDYCDPTDLEKMDLKLLQKRRNKLSHSTTCHLDEPKYNAYLSEIKIISERCLKSLNDQTLKGEVNAILNNDEEFSLARLTELMNELKEKIPTHIEEEDTSQTQPLLSQITDILKQLYPEDNAMSITDIKLKLDVKKCEKNERYLCEKVMKDMIADNEDVSYDIKQALYQSLMELIKHDVEIVSAGGKSIIITLGCPSVHDGNMCNDQENATEHDKAECSTFERTVSAITKRAYTLSHDGNDTYVKINATVDSFDHMKQIIDICEYGTTNISLENTAIALKENLRLEVSVDENATLKQIKDRFLPEISKTSYDDNTDDSALQKGKDASNSSGNQEGKHRETISTRLTHANTIPNNEKLLTLCQTEGRKSERVQRACSSIRLQILSCSKKFKYVWAAYRPEDTGKIVFVIIIEDGSSVCFDFPAPLDTFEVVFRELGSFHNKERDVQSEKCFSETERSNGAQLLQIHSPHLMEMHSNINIISMACIKPKQANKEPKTCIVFYVHIKGLIPFLEEPFPSYIGTMKTIVREGAFECHGSRIDYSNEGKLKSGQLVGRATNVVMDENKSDSQLAGTVCAFVDIDIESDKICFITCAHAVLTSEDLNKIIEKKRISYN